MPPAIIRIVPALLPGLLLPSLAARAQAVAKPGFGVEATLDERRRGLSWSDGRPTLSATGYLPIAAGFDMSAGATGLRGSARHDGADLGIDLAARFRHDPGPWRLSGGVIGHVFAGASGLSYAEGDLQFGYLIGAATLALGASYAPRQHAIGGDNLYLSADADLAFPGSPWRLRGGVGHSSGTVSHTARAERLRPGGAYWDYRLSVEHIQGMLTWGTRLTATSIRDTPVAPIFDDRNRGARMTAFVRFDI